MYIQVVISKYKENIDWVNQITHPIVIYDKSSSPIKNSIPRPNIGREAETLLYHIIDNYNKLPEFLIFAQGDPRGNPIQYTYEDIINFINNGPFGYKSLANLDGNANLNTYFKPESKFIYKKYFKNLDPIVWYSMGAEYIIPRYNILYRPKSFYQILYQRLIDTKDLEIDPWSIEPIFGIIFNPKYELNENY